MTCRLVDWYLRRARDKNGVRWLGFVFLCFGVGSLAGRLVGCGMPTKGAYTPIPVPWVMQAQGQ